MSEQRGVGLIELLVTLLVLSTSLIALAALQTRSLQYNQGSYLRSQANVMAYDILDRIRVNQINMGNYNIALTDEAPSGILLAQTDIKAWRGNLKSTLPNGNGAIQCAVAGVCLISITWTELDKDQTVVTSFNYSAKM